MAASGLWEATPLRAQCAPLDLLDLGVAAGRITADSVEHVLDVSQWQLHKGANPYWTFRTPGEGETPEELAEAWVGLRRNNQQASYDLVYKTRNHACIVRLRADLRRRAKLKSEPINCVQCEGERLVGEGYTVSIFNQKVGYLAKRTSYPYVLVIRRNTGKTDGSTSAPEDVPPTGNQ